MFRRKEEGSLDEHTATAANSSTGANNYENVSNQPQAAAAAASYVPAQPAAARPAAESRPVAAAPSYRATPVTDFTRSAARPVTEALRNTSQQQQAAPSFGTANEKEKSAQIAHSAAPSTKANRRVLTVGNDILLKGEIATCDRLVIEGRVEAKLSDVHTVEIANVGSFKGTAEVEDAEVSGLFEGDLVVRNRLVIYASGEVRGNITYGEIEIERGGKFTGQIKTVNSPVEKPKLLDVKARPAKEAMEA